MVNGFVGFRFYLFLSFGILLANYSFILNSALVCVFCYKYMACLVAVIK